jgi:glutathione gamma-glutamylcysteinyltransferase
MSYDVGIPLSPSPTNLCILSHIENGTEIKDTSWFISNELSEGLVLFSSDEGRRIFLETGSAGYLNSYFELSQNFLTSFDPKFSCGLATLTMCLNTFRQDPGRIWKDIYRWYAQTMLEHCVPYRIIAGNGIVFQQFACMVECNYLTVALTRHLKPHASIDEFRALCKKTTSGFCEEILVVCYHRVGLDQDGHGHYSPIGAYHPEKDLVLVFDISRYKYPLHWVPVKRLWEAMALDDDVTGKQIRHGAYTLISNQQWIQHS